MAWARVLFGSRLLGVGHPLGLLHVDPAMGLEALYGPVSCDAVVADVGVAKLRRAAMLQCLADRPKVRTGLLSVFLVCDGNE